MILPYFMCLVVAIILQESCVNAKDQDRKELNICFFCGKQCQKDIKTKETMTELGSNVEDIINRIFANSYINMHVSISAVKYSRKSQPLKKYSNKMKGEKGLEKARILFWKNRFEKMQKTNRCGVGFLLSSARDSFWKTCAKDGIAGVATACKTEGTGILKLTTDAERLGTLLAHEVGHQLAMSHDCDPVDNLKPLANVSVEIAEVVNPILDNCGPKHCKRGSIMDPAPLAYSPYPSKYSKCSRAYYNFFIKSKDIAVLDRLYNTECLSREVMNIKRRSYDFEY